MMTKEEYKEELDELYKIAKETGDISLALEILERKRKADIPIQVSKADYK